MVCTGKSMAVNLRIPQTILGNKHLIFVLAGIIFLFSRTPNPEVQPLSKPTNTVSWAKLSNHAQLFPRLRIVLVTYTAFVRPQPRSAPRHHIEVEPETPSILPRTNVAITVLSLFLETELAIELQSEVPKTVESWLRCRANF